MMLLSPYLRALKIHSFRQIFATYSYNFRLLKFTRKHVKLFVATVQQKVIAQVFHNAKHTPHNVIIIVCT